MIFDNFGLTDPLLQCFFSGQCRVIAETPREACTEVEIDNQRAKTSKSEDRAEIASERSFAHAAARRVDRSNDLPSFRYLAPAVGAIPCQLENVLDREQASLRTLLLPRNLDTRFIDHSTDCVVCSRKELGCGLYLERFRRQSKSR